MFSSPCKPKSLSFPLLLDITPRRKIESTTDHILEKKSLEAFRQISLKVLPALYIFSYTIMTYLRKLVGTKSLNTKKSSARLCFRFMHPVSPLLQKIASPLTRCGLFPLSNKAFSGQSSDKQNFHFPHHSMLF